LRIEWEREKTGVFSLLRKAHGNPKVSVRGAEGDE